MRDIIANLLIDGMPWMNGLRAVSFLALWVILWRQPTTTKLGHWTNALFLFTFLTSAHVAYLAHFLTVQADENDVNSLETWALVVGLNFLPLAASVAGIGVVIYTIRANKFLISHEGVFGTLAQAMPIIVANHKGTIQHTTQALSDLVGWEQETLVGQDLSVIMPDRYHGQHAQGIERYVETRVPHIIGKVVPVEMKRKDGTEIPVYLALNTTDVEGMPWFIASIWAAPESEHADKLLKINLRETDLATRELLAAEIEKLNAATSQINTERGFTLSKAGVLIMEDTQALNVRQTGMDEQQVHMDAQQKVMDDERNQA